uniref:Uncharacterized protein n=1 Tax=viral metagenome TaxID=1070528 RepID=A0A6C0BC40_9ZZZZ
MDINSPKSAAIATVEWLEFDIQTLKQEIDGYFLCFEKGSLSVENGTVAAIVLERQMTLRRLEKSLVIAKQLLASLD